MFYLAKKQMFYLDLKKSGKSYSLLHIKVEEKYISVFMALMSAEQFRIINCLINPKCLHSNIDPNTSLSKVLSKYLEKLVGSLWTKDSREFSY